MFDCSIVVSDTRELEHIAEPDSYTINNYSTEEKRFVHKMKSSSWNDENSPNEHGFLNTVHQLLSEKCFGSCD